MAKKKKIFKNLKEECDFMWSLLIKATAGFASEVNGESECRLQSHHITGKSSLGLRYSVLNGYCCSEGQHKFGFHHTGRAEGYRSIVEQQRGKDIWDKLSVVKRLPSKKLNQYHLQLLVQLKEYELSITEFYESKDYKTKAVRDKYEYVISLIKKIK
jgi:hypothetical protein